MAREYPERYSEYKNLLIPKQTEIDWTSEQLEEKYKIIKNEEDNKSLWHIHSSMTELVLSLKTDEALKKIIDVTEFIKNKIPYSQRVLVAETINGRGYRKFRGGLIYLSFDLNNKKVAKEFVELALYFSDKGIDTQRCKKSMKLTKEIKKELRL